MEWYIAFGRCVIAGTLTSGAAGAIYGVVTFQHAGAVVVGMAAAFIGGVLAVLDGIARGLLAWWLRQGPLAAGVTAALTYAAVGALYGRLGNPFPHPEVTCAVIAAAVGALVGPVTIFGVRPTPARERLARVIGLCAVAGVLLGAAAGLVIGLYGYWPTAPFAIVEGALFGGGCGIVVAVLVSLAWLPFLSPDVPAR